MNPYLSRQVASMALAAAVALAAKSPADEATADAQPIRKDRAGKLVHHPVMGSRRTHNRVDELVGAVARYAPATSK